MGSLQSWLDLTTFRSCAYARYNLVYRCILNSVTLLITFHRCRLPLGFSTARARPWPLSAWCVRSPCRSWRRRWTFCHIFQWPCRAFNFDFGEGAFASLLLSKGVRSGELRCPGGRSLWRPRRAQCGPGALLATQSRALGFWGWGRP